MQEVAADVVSSATHRSGGQAGSCGGRGQPTASGRRALKKLSDLNACEN